MLLNSTTPLWVLVVAPFLFFIMHPSTGAPLFAGRVVDPSQTN